MNKKIVLSVSFFLLLALSFVVRSEDDLQPGFSINLGELTVTASKIEQAYKQSTQNISVVAGGEIGQTGADEFSQVLDLLPSVDVVEYGTAGSVRSVRTRGSYTQQVLTLIDGRPINVPRDGLTDFNQISLTTIDRIEVLRGPASNIYGANAVGGVINVITKTGQEDMHTELLSKYGSFATSQATFSHGYKIGDFDYFLAYDYLASHGHRDNTDYLSHNASTKFGYRFDEDNHLAVSSGYFTSKTGSPGPTAFTDLDNRTDTVKKFIDATYRGKLAEDQDLFLKFFHNVDRLEFIWSHEPSVKDTHQTKVYGLDAQVSQTFFDIFRTALGGSFQEHRLNSSTSGKPTYNLKGAYVETETDFYNQGSFKLGARWDDYSNFGDRISPSASFNFWLFDTIKLHALAARSFRAPTFNDVYWPTENWGLPAFLWPIYGRGAMGNLNIGPEKATSFEAGISAFLFDKVKTDVTLFKTEYTDLIEWMIDPTTFFWTPTNVASAKTQGAEIETEVALDEKVKVNFNYTYLEATNKATGRWLTYRPRHLYKIKLIYSPTPKWVLGLTSIYKTKRFSDAMNTSSLPHTCTVNINTSYKITDSTELLLEIKNIFDRHYEEQQGYPLPGRAFYGGVKIEL
ncbi:TonB-dependent receptor plug domain-containing protein [Candidatus Omnitrophota bacterium]